MNEGDRGPLIDARGRALLEWMHEHPHAPRFNHRCGDRLSAAGLRRVQAFAAELQAAPPTWGPGEQPAWLDPFVARVLADVPLYRRWGATAGEFSDLPTTDRGDLAREPWSFVPDAQPLDDLIVYCTSGTSGQPLDVLSHPETASMYLPLLQAALAPHGIRLDGGPGRVACVLVCWQRRTVTYASISAYLGQAGFAKVNLAVDNWRDANDRARYLDACQADVYTGDPLAFDELARLPLTTRPRALISSAMTLLPGQRARLEGHFGCPVLDVYGMNEAGPIAVAADEGYTLLQPRLYVEILDPDGEACPPGQRGEVALTGGFNPFLPLLRYRTGDYASLEFRGRQPMLVGLEGRPPVVFRGAQGQRINNIDVSAALRPFALAQFNLHQGVDGALRVRLSGRPADTPRLTQALEALFGPGQAITVVETDTRPGQGDKIVPYTSDLP